MTGTGTLYTIVATNPCRDQSRGPGLRSPATLRLAALSVLSGPDPCSGLCQALDVGVQVDTSETITLKGMYFQLVDNQVLSTQGQPDVFNLHRLTSKACTVSSFAYRASTRSFAYRSIGLRADTSGSDTSGSHWGRDKG